jgi:hypothetical protein
MAAREPNTNIARYARFDVDEITRTDGQELGCSAKIASLTVSTNDHLSGRFQISRRHYCGALSAWLRIGGLFLSRVLRSRADSCVLAQDGGGRGDRVRSGSDPGEGVDLS